MTGVDTSLAVAEKAGQKHPRADVRSIEALSQLSFEDKTFDLVILIVVLTSCPYSDERQCLIEEAARVLNPAGHLFISDMPMQSRFAGSGKNKTPRLSV